MFGDVDAEVSLDYWSLIDSNLSATDSAAEGKADNHASIGRSADDVRAVSEDRPEADSEYEPSSVNGGTAEQFPVDDVLPEYNPTRSLERAWNAIPGDKPALFGLSYLTTVEALTYQFCNVILSAHELLVNRSLMHLCLNSQSVAVLRIMKIFMTLCETLQSWTCVKNVKPNGKLLFDVGGFRSSVGIPMCV